MISKRVRVVLVGVEGSINLGSVARLCKNFGVEELYLVKPEASIDDEAYKYAMRGRDILSRAIVVSSLEEAFRDIELVACTSSIVPVDRDLLRQPIELREFVKILEKYRSIAIVFGRESTGLNREELSKCHVYVHIAADKEYPVLNLSHAVAIVLYEIHSMYSERISVENIEEPQPEDYKLAEKYISEIVDLVMRNVERSEEIKTSLKRILYKSTPTKTEINLLIKTLSKITTLLKRCSRVSTPPPENQEIKDQPREIL
ncbi:MAG: TrmJ/YjtD family RNA methyltransferase [Sulfolobales archaeon]